MSVVKLEALKCLAGQLADFCPELGPSLKGDRIHHTQVPPEKPVGFPSLALVHGGKTPFRASQEAEHYQPEPGSLVVCVGHWEMTVQLRLAHTTPGQRYALQDKLFSAFFQRSRAPGVLVSPVTTAVDVGPFYASWDLDDEDWDEEMAFSSQNWGTLTINGWIPTLVTRYGVYSLNDLRLGLHSPDEAPPATSEGFDSKMSLQVSEDGTLTPIQGDSNGQ